MSHRKTEHVVVVPYDKNWPAEFERIRKDLVAALGKAAIGIEHVGSTSVEGLWAKPILDIDVIIRGCDCLPGVIGRLAANLYVCPQDSPELKRHMVFRNYLRAYPEDAAAYGEVKRQGAGLFPYDIEGYLSYKSACIREIYKKYRLQE